MDKQTTREVLATLIRAGRRDLALAVSKATKDAMRNVLGALLDLGGGHRGGKMQRLNASVLNAYQGRVVTALMDAKYIEFIGDGIDYIRVTDAGRKFAKTKAVAAAKH